MTCVIIGRIIIHRLNIIRSFGLHLTRLYRNVYYNTYLIKIFLYSKNEHDNCISTSYIIFIKISSRYNILALK